MREADASKPMSRHQMTVQVLGPWSLATSGCWEGFAPSAWPSAATRASCARCSAPRPTGAGPRWSWPQEEGDLARLVVTGDGDLEGAAGRVLRSLSLDVDGRGWVEVATRDPVIADAQDRLPGLRPCGFHSAYEAAVWSVLSQRIRMVQAARLREELVRRRGDDGAFPAPQVLLTLDLDLPGRKAEYVHAVAEAALDGRLDSAVLSLARP